VSHWSRSFLRSLALNVSTEASVPGQFRGRALEATVPPRALCEKLAESMVIVNGLGLLAREVLRAVGIDPSRHPTGGPHQIFLGLVTRDDGLDVSSDPPREIVLDKGVDIRVLQHYILEGVAHVTCS
jgi:hypothetical protein